MDLSVYDLPFEGVEKTLIEWVTESLELRHGVAGDPGGRLELPPYEIGPDPVLDVLRRTRVRLDRVEELQSKARQAKGRIHRTRVNAEFQAKIAHDTAMQEQGARRTKSFVTADEKRADAFTASLEEQRVAHQLNRAESVADEAYDVIKNCYWGLDKIRTELLEMLRVHNSLTHMETTSGP